MEDSKILTLSVIVSVLITTISFFAIEGTGSTKVEKEERTDQPGYLQPTDIYIGRRPKMRETEWSKTLAKSMGLDETSTEYRLPNGTRIDIFDRGRGISWEVEWCDKWPESIGQSKFYANATGTTPGVILLLRGDYEEDWLECVSGITDERSKYPEFKFYYIDTE